MELNHIFHSLLIFNLYSSLNIHVISIKLHLIFILKKNPWIILIKFSTTNYPNFIYKFLTHNNDKLKEHSLQEGDKFT